MLDTLSTCLTLSGKANKENNDNNDNKTWLPTATDNEKKKKMDKIKCEIKTNPSSLTGSL